MFSGDRSSPARPCVRLLPREEKFFDLFVAVADRNTEAARHLRELFEAPPERRTPHVEAMRLEEEGDAIYHEALGRLFATERDALEVIKWKEIYDTLERTLDESEDVANVLESITLKHA